MHAQSLQQMSDVIADCLRRQMELCSDLFGRPARREQVQNLFLARRQVRLDRTGRLMVEPGNCKDRAVGIVAG
jgi:hypothetical protein